MAKGPALALLVQVALAGLAALLARRAKPAAVLLGAAGFFAAPWLAGPIPLLRAFSALVGFVALLRIIDAVRSREPWSACRRVLHVASVVDSRTLRRAPAHVDLGALAAALLWAALAGAGFYVAHAPRQLVRWAGGLVLAYAAVEWLYAFTRAAYRALGFVPPRLHVLPVASISVAELWGARWSRPVSSWLRETCFRPLARRGHPALGVLLGFVVSAIGHAYPVLVALDLRMAAMMFAFFFAQGIFVIVEARLGAPRWPRAARRAWTVTIMVASSPLFVEPALCAIGLS
jgi:Arc/MetJ family transcription regulator